MGGGGAYLYITCNKRNILDNRNGENKVENKENKNIFRPKIIQIKGNDRLCKVVELSMQCCGKHLSDSFETYKTFLRSVNHEFERKFDVPTLGVTFSELVFFNYYMFIRFKGFAVFHRVYISEKFSGMPDSQQYLKALSGQELMINNKF